MERKSGHQGILCLRWQRVSLRLKATSLALALGILPLVAIGATAYYIANQAIVKQIKQEQQNCATEIADKVNRFMFDRYADIQVMASLPIFRNPKLWAVTTPQERQVALNHFLNAYRFYDKIAVADLAGNTIVQSRGKPDAGLSRQDYFQQVIKTNRPVIAPPRKSAMTGQYSIFIAAPIIDTATGKIIGVICSRMPVQFITEVVENFGTNGDMYHLFDSARKYFVAMATIAREKDELGTDVLQDFPTAAPLIQGGKVASEILTDTGNHTRLVTYTALKHLEGLPNLNLGCITHC